jgi:Sec-independent protein translocase protein TatA
MLSVFGMGFGEVATLLLVALVVFGPRELPRYLGKAGQSVGRARDWARDIEDDRALAAVAFAALTVMALYLIGFSIHVR